jgi:hypothetical protein
MALMGPNELPSFVYPASYVQMNYWVVLLLLYLVLKLMLYMNYGHALLSLMDSLLFMIRSLGSIGFGHARVYGATSVLLKSPYDI